VIERHRQCSISTTRSSERLRRRTSAPSSNLMLKLNNVSVASHPVLIKPFNYEFRIVAKCLKIACQNV
jgi:hypothetical protein